jgi:hypothetical protein
VVHFAQTNHAGVIIAQNVPSAGAPAQTLVIDVIDVPDPTTSTNYSLVASNIQTLGSFDKIDGMTNSYLLRWTGSNVTLEARQVLTTGTGAFVRQSVTDSLDGQTNALGARATSLEGQMNALGARATSLEVQTNALGSRVSTIESNTNKYQIGSPSLTNLAGNTVPFTNILVGSKRVALSTNAGVVTASVTNPVVNFSGGSTGTGPVATNQLDWAQVGGGTFRMTNASASNQVFQITNAVAGESVTVDCVGTNFILTFVMTGISDGGGIMWGVNSATNGGAASALTHTNSVVILRCVETNRLSAVYANRRR